MWEAQKILTINKQQDKTFISGTLIPSLSFRPTLAPLAIPK